MIKIYQDSYQCTYLLMLASPWVCSNDLLSLEGFHRMEYKIIIIPNCLYQIIKTMKNKYELIQNLPIQKKGSIIISHQWILRGRGLFEAIRSIQIEIKHKRAITKEKYKNQALIILKNYKKKEQATSSVTLEITLSLFLMNLSLIELLRKQKITLKIKRKPKLS